MVHYILKFYIDDNKITLINDKYNNSSNRIYSKELKENPNHYLDRYVIIRELNVEFSDNSIINISYFIEQNNHLLVNNKYQLFDENIISPIMDGIWDKNCIKIIEDIYYSNQFDISKDVHHNEDEELHLFFTIESEDIKYLQKKYNNTKRLQTNTYVNYDSAINGYIIDITFYKNLVSIPLRFINANSDFLIGKKVELFFSKKHPMPPIKGTWEITSIYLIEKIGK